MIDPTLFRDTFSRLRPSEACVKEIMSMHQKKHTAPRAGLIAAAAVAALCVSAGAVDLATDGALSQGITLAIESVWKVNDYKSVSVMEDGTAMTMYDLTASVETRDGRTFLVIAARRRQTSPTPCWRRGSIAIAAWTAVRCSRPRSPAPRRTGS